MLQSNLWNKLYSEFNDSNRWEVEITPDYHDGAYQERRDIDIIWKPSKVCFDLLYSKYKNTTFTTTNRSINGYLHILKLIFRNYSTNGQAQKQHSETPWKNKTRYGYIWKQNCEFDTNNKTLILHARVPDKLLSYWKINKADPTYLTSQRIKIVLNVPICANDPAFPYIKNSSKNWQNNSKERRHNHCPTGSGAIMFTTHLWCKIAVPRYEVAAKIYDFKSAYEYNYGRIYANPDTGAVDVNKHHRYFTKWVTKDYRINHNRNHLHKKIKK